MRANRNGIAEVDEVAARARAAYGRSLESRERRALHERKTRTRRPRVTVTAGRATSTRAATERANSGTASLTWTGQLHERKLLVDGGAVVHENERRRGTQGVSVVAGRAPSTKRGRLRNGDRDCEAPHATGGERPMLRANSGAESRAKCATTTTKGGLIRDFGQKRRARKQDVEAAHKRGAKKEMRRKEDLPLVSDPGYPWCGWAGPTNGDALSSPTGGRAMPARRLALPELAIMLLSPLQLVRVNLLYNFGPLGEPNPKRKDGRMRTDAKDEAERNQGWIQAKEKGTFGRIKTRNIEKYETSGDEADWVEAEEPNSSASN
ncbi:hypothetical protein B0H11DRAFT_1906730 [Mycena galericulata]|nr:hypothetical protein B0H11DRAFT_1906730 [Mycena galericulata]